MNPVTPYGEIQEGISSNQPEAILASNLSRVDGAETEPKRLRFRTPVKFRAADEARPLREDLICCQKSCHRACFFGLQCHHR